MSNPKCNRCKKILKIDNEGIYVKLHDSDFDIDYFYCMNCFNFINKKIKRWNND